MPCYNKLALDKLCLQLSIQPTPSYAMLCGLDVSLDSTAKFTKVGNTQGRQCCMDFESW